ncbi:MAG: tetratricopeptide repeat protein [Fidelibacterota bacterium]|jgi:outer membrane protein assembly factor BamD (BamD/ComL family)
MKSKKIFILFITFSISSCGLFKSAEDLFSEAEIKRNSGESKVALSLLKKVVSKHQAHVIAPEAQYLIAEIYYRDMRDFSKAIEEYDILRTTYYESKQVPFALFMQGFIYANMLSDFSQAESHYKEFLKIYTDHELAKSVSFELKYLGRDVKDIPELKHLTQ